MPKQVLNSKSIFDDPVFVYKLEEVVDRIVGEKLDEKLKFLPTKDEFYNQMDHIVKLLNDMKDELTMVTYRVGQHDESIERLEAIHPGFSH